ncbi:MAG: 2'-5' RNA ligase family protein [Nocardioides marinisabuli]|uniref:2'-5' RNA ligase family protein n=1 Tax=Nocardioides marinisabuli TaxID=419476 RepID=UPI003219307D
MSGHPTSGHTVLAVPVPALDDWVRARTHEYDPAWVSSDPAFVHAHVTVLAPWVPAPDDADLGRVAALLAAVPAFEARLGEVDVFPNGLVHLRPEPHGWFAALTGLLAEAYPQHPPYEGRYGAVEPHLSLDQVGPGPTRVGQQVGQRVTVGSVAGDLSGRLPVRTRVDRVDLQWWQADGCRLLHSFPLAAEAVA